MKNIIHNSSKKEGFTLIEMIVSMALFITVLAVSMGALMVVAESNKKAQSMRAAMDNLGLAMEEMTRNIRQGRIYHCNVLVNSPPLNQFRACTNGASSIAFEAHYGSTSVATDQVHYRLATTTNRIQKSTDNGATYVDITSPELQINNLMFYVKGVEPPDGIYPHVIQHPRVTVVVGGVAGISNPNSQTEFSFQTTISQRAPEI